jgi:hypothetical protein
LCQKSSRSLTFSKWIESHEIEIEAIHVTKTTSLICEGFGLKELLHVEAAFAITEVRALAKSIKNHEIVMKSQLPSCREVGI